MLAAGWQGVDRVLRGCVPPVPDRAGHPGPSVARNCFQDVSGGLLFRRATRRSGNVSRVVASSCTGRADARRVMPSRLSRDQASAVLDAAADCYLRLGVTKTTAADIASAAGISRATLYRRFSSHEVIFMAVLERESAAMAAEASAELASIADPADRLVESMVFSISRIGDRPVHAAIFSGESAAWAAGRAIRMDALRR